jgi:hypothetical protein
MQLSWRCSSLHVGILHMRCTQCTQVTWLVNTESALLRQRFLERYGPAKVITRLNQASHILLACSAIVGAKNITESPEACSEAAMDASLVEAVGTVWGMAMCDFHVITVNSGFGRVAAWLSARWHNIYELDGPPKKAHSDLYGEWQVPTTKCLRGQYTRYETSATNWSGI